MGNNPQFITQQGLRDLGELMRFCRLQRGWTTRQLSAVIEAASGNSLSVSQVSNLESGKHVPSWDTLTMVAAARYVIDPETNQPLTQAEMFMIASGEKSISVPPFQDEPQIKVNRRTRFKPAHPLKVYA